MRSKTSTIAKIEAEVLSMPNNSTKVVQVKKQFMVRSSSGIYYGLVQEPAAFF